MEDGQQVGTGEGLAARKVVRHLYPPEVKAEALAVLVSCGGNVCEASRRTGIPEKTIAYWRDRPATGRDRASLAIREELLGQKLEREMWALLRAARPKLKDAKLASVATAFAAMFDRWKTLRDRAGNGAANAGATGGLDLDRLTSDELRTLLALVGKAGGTVPEGMGPPDDSGASEGAGLPVGGSAPGDLPPCEDAPALVVVSAAEVLQQDAAP